MAQAVEEWYKQMPIITQSYLTAAVVTTVGSRYCKLLEENSFREKTADFLYMLLFGATVLTGLCMEQTKSLYPYEFPWPFQFYNSGMIAGHAYYFLAFVYPQMTDRRPLKTPSFLKALFTDEPVVIARPEDVRFAHVPFDEIHQD